MGPLEGVRILEIAGIGPGPFAGMMLSDMGAEVLRVDRAQVRVAVPTSRDRYGFSRTFLLDAVRAARAEHLTLSLDDDGTALGVSPADRPDDVGLVMPVRLHRPGAEGGRRPAVPV